jgi:hypothetical protein
MKSTKPSVREESDTIPAGSRDSSFTCTLSRRLRRNKSTRNCSFFMIKDTYSQLLMIIISSSRMHSDIVLCFSLVRFTVFFDPLQTYLPIYQCDIFLLRGLSSSVEFPRDLSKRLAVDCSARTRWADQYTISPALYMSSAHWISG